MRIHGQRKSGTYLSWTLMKQRCLNKNAPDYAVYGGKGITICKQWLKFINFYADMGDRPTGLTLERIDNEKGYKPNNCRWASRRDQSINRSITRWITFNGETLCVTDWARRYGLSKARLFQRLEAGWSIKKALITPLSV